MRNQLRNNQDVWYALYEGEYDLKDENGLRTGEKIQSYSAPVCLRMNVSPARGTVDNGLFGIDTPYTKTLVTCDMDCPIKEDSVLWIGADPTGDYNYVVVRIARSLNSIIYAVREVNVS